ncbi:hypothetical protein R1sor_016852 [Riccia sorocarpa]|uniref:Uncharacterized protein n=1 Tax=Riccia sorocarpa TaxID=122646 RepID=A0ABD3HG23_9MARC
MHPEAKNILGNRARIESVTEAIAEEFKDKQEDEGTHDHLLPNLLSEVNGGTDLVTTVSSEVGGGSDLILALPSEVDGGTAEVPTLPSDFIPRVEDDSSEKRNAEVTKGIETYEHHGEVHAEHIEEHQEPSEQAYTPGLAAQTLDVIDKNQVVDAKITDSGTINIEKVDDQRSSEGFMDRSSKTVAGDVIGTKKVIRRNGVQEFITRCLELFDIALWTCRDCNLLYDYTFYLFSG